MFLNGILYNSEAWHAVSEAEIRMLEVVDEHLLRALVKGQSKTPLEFLYLEAGAIPIRYLISGRRLLYHQLILQRNGNEITEKIYQEHKVNPVPGDFAEMIKQDLMLIGEDYMDQMIQTISRN